MTNSYDYTTIIFIFSKCKSGLRKQTENLDMTKEVQGPHQQKPCHKMAPVWHLEGQMFELAVPSENEDENGTAVDFSLKSCTSFIK